MEFAFTQEHVEKLINKAKAVRVLTQQSNYENHVAVRESDMIVVLDDVLGDVLGPREKIKLMKERYAATNESLHRKRVRITWGGTNSQ